MTTNSTIKLYKSKVAVVSDIHAGVHQHSLAWHDVLRTWAAWFKEECLKHEVRDIIIPGDLFHHRNEINVHTIGVVTEVLEMFAPFNIIILVGNHDAYYKNKSDVHSLDPFSHWPNITVIDEVTTFTSFDKDITICPWGVTLDQIPKCDIIFGHLELQGFKYAKQKICAHGISSKEILAKAPLVITGHFHIRDERKYQDGTILYVGSAYELTWGDSETSKGYYILDVPSSTFQFYENNITPKHKKILLSDIIQHGVTEEVRNNIKGNWVKLVIDRKIKVDSADKLISKLNTLNPLTLLTEYTFENSFEDIEYEFTGVDINDCFREFIGLLDVEHKDQVIEYVLDLYKRVS